MFGVLEKNMDSEIGSSNFEQIFFHVYMHVVFIQKNNNKKKTKKTKKKKNKLTPFGASFFWILQKTLVMLFKTQCRGFRGRSQATLLPFALYFNDDQDFLQNLCYCTLSDCLNCDASVVHAFIYQV